MDLLTINPKIKANEGAFLHLEHPVTGVLLYEDDDLKKPVGLTLLGSDSDKFSQIIHKKRNAFNANRKQKQSSEKDEQDALELLADSTVGWSNLTVAGDSKFSKENVKTLYRELAWVKEQADKFIADRANFI